MKEITKADISQEVFDLYDDYVHNKIERRQFIEKLSLFAVGSLTVPTPTQFYDTKLQEHSNYSSR